MTAPLYPKAQAATRQAFVAAAVENLALWSMGDRRLDYIREATLLLEVANEFPDVQET